MAFAYGSENRWHDQYFDTQKSLAATDIDCANALAVGQHHGALAVVLVANGAVSIASAASVKVSILGSAATRKTGSLRQSRALRK